MVAGLISLRSPSPPKEASERLAAAIRNHGMAVIANVDHAAAAVRVNLGLRPTKVFLFGNPAESTLLMQKVQAIGLDLSLKPSAHGTEAKVN